MNHYNHSLYFMGIALILCSYHCTVFALTVEFRQQQQQRRSILQNDRFRRLPSSSSQFLPQRLYRYRLLLHASSSSFDSLGDGNSAVQESTDLDIKSVETVLSSFREWYSSPSKTDTSPNRQTNTSLVSLLAQDIIWDDCHYTYQPIVGVGAVERHLRLQRIKLLGTLKAPISLVIDEIITINHVDNTGTITIGFMFHDAERTNGSAEGMAILSRRGLVVLDIKPSIDQEYRIVKAEIIREKAFKTGEFSLRILSLASNILTRSAHHADAAGNDSVVDDSTATLPELYFDAWNRRDMQQAVLLFTDDISYDDTAFPQAFVGKENLRQHLLKCASCFPETFTFCVDRVSQAQDTARIIVAWHVENANEPLPFTNGLSYYEINTITQKISKGIDFVDSESIKTAGIVDPILSLFQYEPIRFVPTMAWFLYMYVVFISDGILPGANALQLETRTWEEVRDLSLNFFLVAPVLQLPFSPSVHPMLEGVFNVLLSWAAMFAGFLSDDRRNKPNIFPMLPTVIGMQFLTSAFLLPYLAARTPEIDTTYDEKSAVVWEELDEVSKITESQYFGPILAFVGFYSTLWAMIGRRDEFGGIADRYQSFIDLLSIDRVGSSFIVDLIIFAIFQGWFIDDDMQRRGVQESDMKELRWLGKIIPFFGLAVYFSFRPQYTKESNYR
jgi:SnoaL-like domain